MNSTLCKSLVCLASLYLAGCQPKLGELTSIADTMIVGPQYSANKGLYVPDDTRQSLGLKVVEIGEQKVSSTMDLSLRVYEITGEAARASGTVTAEQAHVLEAGQPLQIRTRDGATVQARITALRSQMQTLTGSVEVLAEMPRSTGVAVGAFITASVALDTGERVATVPTSALVHATDGTFVYTVSGEHFVRTAVEVGAMNADMAEIKDGLYSGDQVVSEAAMSLWLTELAAIKGGHACCVMPAKGK